MWLWWIGAVVQLVLLLWGWWDAWKHARGREARLQRLEELWSRRSEEGRPYNTDMTAVSSGWAPHTSAPMYLGMILTVGVFSLAIAKGWAEGDGGGANIVDVLIPELPRALLMTGMGVGVALGLQVMHDNLDTRELREANERRLELAAQAPSRSDDMAMAIENALTPHIRAISRQMQAALKDSQSRNVEDIRRIVDSFREGVESLKEVSYGDLSKQLEHLSDAAQAVRQLPIDIRQALAELRGELREAQQLDYESLQSAIEILGTVPKEVHEIRAGFARELAAQIQGLSERVEAHLLHADDITKRAESVTQAVEALPRTLEQGSQTWRGELRETQHELRLTVAKLDDAARRLTESAEQLHAGFERVDEWRKHLAYSIDQMQKGLDGGLARFEEVTSRLDGSVSGMRQDVTGSLAGVREATHALGNAVFGIEDRVGRTLNGVQTAADALREAVGPLGEHAERIREAVADGFGQSVSPLGEHLRRIEAGIAGVAESMGDLKREAESTAARTQSSLEGMMQRIESVRKDTTGLPTPGNTGTRPQSAGGQQGGGGSASSSSRPPPPPPPPPPPRRTLLRRLWDKLLRRGSRSGTAGR